MLDRRNPTPRDLLAPVAHGLIRVFYWMVSRTSDSQRQAVWTLDNMGDKNIPVDYVAELKLTLKHKGKEQETRLQALTSDRSADA